MTETQIRLVKKTWKIFRSIDPVLVGDTFYSKLFTDNPALRRMFPGNMKMQYQKLVDMLSTIIARLEKWDELAAGLGELAQRHVHYGVRPGHYKLVGKALLWTLGQGLGKEWTPEVKEAWLKCYTAIADTMITATMDKSAGYYPLNTEIGISRGKAPAFKKWFDR